MKRKQQPQPAAEFTVSERREFLYHTVDEMRAINDAADSRLSNDIERDDEATLEMSSACGRAF